MVLPRFILRTTQIIGQNIIKNVNKTNQLNVRLINTSTWLSAGKLGNISLFFFSIYKLFFILERKYTDKHEWVQIDGKIGTIGISQYAQVRHTQILILLLFHKFSYFITGGTRRRSIRTVTRCRHSFKTRR